MSKEEWLAQLVQNMVATHGTPPHLTSVMGMGNAILFSDDAKVADVRAWLEGTKFVKETSRVFVQHYKDMRLVATISNDVYSSWSIEITIE